MNNDKDRKAVAMVAVHEKKNKIFMRVRMNG
jgi:hypothetical protein